MLTSRTYQKILDAAAKHGMSTPELMNFVLKVTGFAAKSILYNLSEEQGEQVLAALASKAAEAV